MVGGLVEVNMVIRLKMVNMGFDCMHDGCGGGF